MKKIALIATTCSLLASAALADQTKLCYQYHFDSMNSAQQQAIADEAGDLSAHNTKVQVIAIATGALAGYIVYKAYSARFPFSQKIEPITFASSAAVAGGAAGMAATPLILAPVEVSNHLAFERIRGLSYDAKFYSGDSLTDLANDIYSDLLRARKKQADLSNKNVDVRTFAEDPDYKLFQRVLSDVITYKPQLCQTNDVSQLYAAVANQAIAEFTRLTGRTDQK